MSKNMTPEEIAALKAKIEPTVRASDEAFSKMDRETALKHLREEISESVDLMSDRWFFARLALDLATGTRTPAECSADVALAREIVDSPVSPGRGLIVEPRP